MNKTFQTILQIKATVGANTFLYYLKRLWLIGKHIPDRVYMNETLKKFLAVLTTVLGQLMKLIGKVIYLLLAAGLPLMLAVKKGMLKLHQALERVGGLALGAGLQHLAHRDEGQNHGSGLKVELHHIMHDQLAVAVHLRAGHGEQGVEINCSACSTLWVRGWPLP